MSKYSECFDCGAFEYTVGPSNAELKYKLVKIQIEMPGRLNSIGGYSVALCPTCFEMMNTDDF